MYKSETMLEHILNLLSLLHKSSELIYRNLEISAHQAINSASYTTSFQDT